MSNQTLLFSRPTDVESTTGFFIDYLTTLTDGVWPVGISFMVFAVVFLNLDGFGAKQAYGAASFASFVTVTLLVSLGAFSSQALIIAILMVVLGVVINGGRS